WRPAPRGRPRGPGGRAATTTARAGGGGPWVTSARDDTPGPCRPRAGASGAPRGPPLARAGGGVPRLRGRAGSRARAPPLAPERGERPAGQPGGLVRGELAMQLGQARPVQPRRLVMRGVVAVVQEQP